MLNVSLVLLHMVSHEAIFSVLKTATFISANGPLVPICAFMAVVQVSNLTYNDQIPVLV